MSLYYWRDDNFKGLLEVANELIDKDVNGYRDYLLFREKGLRNKAFEALNLFLSDTIDWEFKRKTIFLDWIMKTKYLNPNIYDLIPIPLYKGLIEPFLEEWCSTEPMNPVPLRWKGGYDNWRMALSIDPNDEISRKLMINRIDKHIGYSLHELPLGYSGDPDEDLELVLEMRQLVNNLKDKDQIEKFLPLIEENEEVIRNYLEYRNSSVNCTLKEWGLKEGKKTKTN